MTPTTSSARRQIEQITGIGLVANVVLSAVKLMLGIAGNSQAVIADALHSFSDTVSDLVILLGVRFWTAPPDAAHPFGHQKIESFVTGFIALSLLGVAGGIVWNAIHSLAHPRDIRLTWVVILAPLLSIGVKEFLFHATLRAGIRTGSSSLRANAWHHRTDAMSSVPVLVTVLACLLNPKLAFLDLVGAILVSVLIFRVGFRILQDSAGELMDTGMSRQELMRIQAIIEAIPGVAGAHSIRSRRVAGLFYMDLHVQVDGRLSVREGHAISKAVSEVLMNKNPRITDVLVHLEPDQDAASFSST